MQKCLTEYKSGKMTKYSNKNCNHWQTHAENGQKQKKNGKKWQEETRKGMTRNGKEDNGNKW